MIAMMEPSETLVGRPVDTPVFGAFRGGFEVIVHQQIFQVQGA